MEPTAPITESELHLLYMAHLPAIVQLARKITGNENTAEDIAQDVFLLARNHFARKPLTLTNAKAWFLTITKHCCYTCLMKSDREVITSDFDSLAAGEDFIARITDRLTLLAIDKFIQQNYPARESKLFSLRFYHHYTLKEIAEITDLSPGYVHTLLAGTIRRLKQKFGNFN